MICAEAFHLAGRCDAALASSAKPKALAELVCEGQTLELVDDTLLDSLRDALRCAALAAREVSPENA